MEAVPMVNLDVEAIVAPPRPCHDASIGGDFRRADIVRYVDAWMPARKGLGDDALGRPAKPDDLLAGAGVIFFGRTGDIFLLARRHEQVGWQPSVVVQAIDGPQGRRVNAETDRDQSQRLRAI